MSIKLNAQSGGSVALDAPTQTTGSADNLYKLPVADGTAGQVLKTDGSGNLSWTTISSSDNTPMWFVKLGSNYNHPTTNTWQIAPLGSDIFDTDNVFDTSNYKFTVPSGKAGKYFLYYQQHISDNPDSGENMQGRITKTTSGGTVTNIQESYSIQGSTGQNFTTRIHHSFATELAVGDELQMWLYHHEGGGGGVTYQAYATWFGGYKLIGS